MCAQALISLCPDIGMYSSLILTLTLTLFSLSLRQKIFIEGIKKIDEEFIQMAKEKEISARIEKSTEIGNARTKKMTERQNLLDILQGEATTDLASISTSKDYPKLIENLITQGRYPMLKSVSLSLSVPAFV